MNFSPASQQTAEKPSDQKCDQGRDTPRTETAVLGLVDRASIPWQHQSILLCVQAFSLSPLPFPFTTLPASLPAWNATVWVTPAGRNVDAEYLVELDPPELAAAACGLGLLPPFDAGAGGAVPFTALMIPLRMVCARLGCGGGVEDETAAAELVVPVDAVPTPVDTAGLACAPAPAPAAKPVAPDISAPAARAPARTNE